jgi:adenylate cyclase
MIACPSCAAENADHARFCNQCGIRLAAAPGTSAARSSYTPRHLAERVFKDRAAMLGERKRVTVLFCDIKGSTALAQQAGAEAWHQVLDRFFAILGAAVHRYEGTINQYTGDGVMALFGAPVAHEHHAVRACLAALDMQAEVRRFADALRLEQGLNLSMRVGLNTGEVIVGRIGDDLRMDYTAQGPTVNLAARLEHLCEPGRVLLSRTTALLVQAQFELRSLGQARVAGLDEPVEVFELAQRRRGDAGSERRRSVETPFLGRAAEQDQLQAALALAEKGQGRVLGLSGAAGLGKSRLCREFADAAVRRGIPVHQTRASPYERHLAMSAPVALLRSRMNLGPRSEAAEVRRRILEVFPDPLGEHPRVHAFIRDFLGVAEAGEMTVDIAASLREPMMRELARWLPSSTVAQVIVFEDLHHLDAVTLEFVRLLAAAVRGTRSLLLLTWREDSAPAPLPALDAHLRLAPLPAPAVEQLAAALLGDAPSVRGLPAQLAPRAGGNPYFVEEAVTALSETGHLAGEPGAYRLLQPLDHWPMPDSVHALIAARIDRLPPAQKAALQAASVIGKAFEASQLAAMHDDPRAGELLHGLCEAGFLQHGDNGELGFTQPLLREVAYSTQLESGRRVSHANLARVLERAAGTRPVSEQAGAIAHHWAAAQDWARAGLWNLNAARWLGPRNARATLEQYEAAIVHLDRAPFSDEVRHARISARSGLVRMAQFWTLDDAQVARAYAEARQLADECGDPLCAAELAVSYGNWQLHRGEAERAVASVVEGVHTCPAPQRAAFVDRFRLTLLLTHSAVGRVQEGVDLVNAEGGTDWLTRPIDADNNLSRGFLCLGLAWTGELARASDELGQCIAWAERDGRGTSWMHSLRADFAWFSGDTDGLLSACERAVEQARDFGSLYFRAIALRALGQALILLDRHEEAIAPLTEALPQTARGAGAFQFEAHHLAVLSEACLGAGRLAQAARWARDAVDSAQRSGSRLWGLRAWSALLALPESELGEAAARAGFEHARALMQSTGGWSFRPRLDELAALRASDPQERAGLMQRAVHGYERIGATAHAARLRRSEA